MISIRDYATKHNVTYEAVRKQIQRYEKELDGHIIKENNLRYLDEFAEEYITEKRRKSIITITNEVRNEELEELRKQVESMKLLLMEHQDKIIKLQDERIGLIEKSAKADLLIETNKEKEKELEELKQAKSETDLELKEVKKRLEESEKQANSYHRSWFGFYRKNEY